MQNREKELNKILRDKDLVEMLETNYGEVTLEFEKDDKTYKGTVINIPLKYFLTDDMLEDFIKDIIQDLYNEDWDFSKEINFLEIVGE